MKKLIGLDPIERFDSLPAIVASQNGGGLKGLSPLCTLMFEESEACKDEEFSIHPLLGIVCALYGVDKVFANEIGYNGHVYILGDDCIMRLIADGEYEIAGQLQHNQDLCTNLEALATLGLIYRFNVARKFGNWDNNVMQLRVNSWGRYLFESRELYKLPSFKIFYSRWSRVLSGYKQEYIRLLELCHSIRQPLPIQEIRALNSTVPIPVVT